MKRLRLACCFFFKPFDWSSNILYVTVRSSLWKCTSVVGSLEAICMLYSNKSHKNNATHDYSRKLVKKGKLTRPSCVLSVTNFKFKCFLERLKTFKILKRLKFEFLYFCLFSKRYSILHLKIWYTNGYFFSFT